MMNSPKMVDESNQSFWQHAQDLRNTLLKSLAVIFTGILISLCFYPQIFSILQSPLLGKPSKSLHHEPLIYTQITNSSEKNELFSLPANTKLHSKSDSITQIDQTTFLIPPENFIVISSIVGGKKLHIFGPIDGISSTFKVCFFIGALITSPIWGYFILSFIAPALDPKFYRIIIPFLILSFLFMLIGASFAFFLTIPIANQYLELFNQEIGINLWSLSNYLDYTIVLIAGNAICFEMSVIAFLSVHHGVLTGNQLRRGRRYFIVGAFIIAALLTPPDVLTQVMLAVPLIILYECAILYARVPSGLF